MARFESDPVLASSPVEEEKTAEPPSLTTTPIVVPRLRHGMLYVTECVMPTLDKTHRVIDLPHVAIVAVQDAKPGSYAEYTDAFTAEQARAFAKALLEKADRLDRVLAAAKALEPSEPIGPKVGDWVTFDEIPIGASYTLGDGAETLKTSRTKCNALTGVGAHGVVYSEKDHARGAVYVIRSLPGRA